MESAMPHDALPVAVIGAGPVGLAAAAHLLERGAEPIVLEAGAEAGAAVADWGHVQMFSPWRFNIDRAARALLEQTGWRAPGAETMPTGRELIDGYLAPLATHPAIVPRLRFGARVVAVGRRDFDKVKTEGREAQPFVVRLADGSEIQARAVIDASGAWGTQNALGAGGVPAMGEREHADRIVYGIPDVLGAARERYADRKTLVVGSGHSAINAVLDLVALRREAPATEITWAMRRADPSSAFGGGNADALPARGLLGEHARQAVADGSVALMTPFHARAVARSNGHLRVEGRGSCGLRAIETDQVIVATGVRPDFGFLSEIRLGLDPWLESAQALGPLIDPNLHSCGTVRPHGAKELAHPERDFYILGMKSYGRAPTFLLATGYEQARSVAAALTGDAAAAARVELDLPQTGVCSADRAPASSCAPKETKSSCCG
jgi:hypothetical protein